MQRFAFLFKKTSIFPTVLEMLPPAACVILYVQAQRYPSPDASSTPLPPSPSGPANAIFSVNVRGRSDLRDPKAFHLSLNQRPPLRYFLWSFRRRSVTADTCVIMHCVGTLQSSISSFFSHPLIRPINVCAPSYTDLVVPLHGCQLCNSADSRLFISL